ncbi:triphosphoribosyl-dephospho-CoA synthase CitG [Blautia sp. MSJ-19]|uniref:triphosphoribosyl-dephospho-CoA synthase CitG n=1 Tax=Blautia sp. MSJ-19 TaxID=2841517 RepID=UPI001C0F21A2|nr:triphosphoribosyl-dephospho-CoA synthase CitG [Blautia sp. MSJ-19]MBU5481681.1 triphosphoribosyl-dephospho-CoA synthase CitG [Blautia sp. MSJ-19]
MMYAEQKSRMITAIELECCIYSALLGEVYTTPKPGLVDCHDTGAHQDMDVHTFERSAEAITPYISRMFYRGYHWIGKEERLFEEIRKIGIQAEHAMYDSTDGVNTHKGLIFTMGILAAAAGNCYQKEHCFEAGRILKKAASMTAGPLEEEFQRMGEHEPITHGEILFREYGEKGIRGEAQKGFPIIGKTALPVLRSTRMMGMDTNRSNIQVLLAIMSELNDTNVWSRGSYHEMQWLKEQAAEICRQGGVFLEAGIRKIEELNELCIRKNLSPGGAADILAASLFLYYLENLMQEE